jgi:hypothetical protein
VLTVAKIAGVNAAKRNAEIIPLCHTLPLDLVDVDFQVEDDRIIISSIARCVGRTGVEMEALAAAAGIEAGREATAEALAYGWEHWDRVGSMENPVGYLYRVGRSKARKRVEVNPSEFVGGVQFCLPS